MSTKINKRLTPIESDSRPNSSDNYKRRSQTTSNDHHVSFHFNFLGFEQV